MTYTQPQSKAFSSYAGERDTADHKKAALISNSCMYKTENALKIKTTGKKKSEHKIFRRLRANLGCSFTFGHQGINKSSSK